MYSNNYEVLNLAGDGYNCIHTYKCMLTFCVTAIIYYTCHVYLVLHHQHVIILINIFNQFDNDQIYS